MIFDVWLPEFNVMLHYNANYLIDLLQARFNEQQNTMTLNLVKGSETGYFIPSATGYETILHILMPLSVKDEEIDEEHE